jgi:histidinol-phosphate aminotransferase
MVKTIQNLGVNRVQPKYYKSHAMNRERIPVPSKETLEMHRNTKIDFYSQDFDKRLKKFLNFKELNRYPDVELLYSRLAEFHNLKEDNFLLTSGIDGGIKTIFEMCTQQDSNIICITPTYGMYYVYAEAFETNMIEIDSKPSSLNIDLNEILGNINDSISVAFIVNPHEPIEHVFTIDEVRKICEKAKQHDVLIFLDEAYYMFGSCTSVNLINEYDNLVVARTFSKGIGLPSIRLGYLISNKNFIKYLESKRFAHETNSLTIDIAIWAIDNINIFEKYAQEVCSTRDWLINELSILGCATHGNKSNTILICLESKEKANYVVHELKKSNILVRGFLPNPAQNCISVTIGSMKLTKVFLKNFKRITLL